MLVPITPGTSGCFRTWTAFRTSLSPQQGWHSKYTRWVWSPVIILHNIHRSSSPPPPPLCPSPSASLCLPPFPPSPFFSLLSLLCVPQDNFAFSEEYESAHGVYEAIQDVMENHIVTHENDRAWRNAVVMNKPSLLALRYCRVCVCVCVCE